MKSFLDHLKEEVLPTVQVADGGLDIDKPAVRAAINAAIAGVVSQPAVTPYVVFNRLSKLLAQYHIVLPKKFLEGDRGVEVFEIRQFGHKMGMTDSGEFVNEVPTTHYLFLQYGIITPFGITYAKPVVGGMFRVMARLVDKQELDKLIDMAEITMAEEAECMQAMYKANAPKEEMKDITSDEKKKGNKEAVGASEKKSLDEEEKKPYRVGATKKDKGGRTVERRDYSTHSVIVATHDKEGKSLQNKWGGHNPDRVGKPNYIRKHFDKMEEEKNDLKDACWKGYTAKGLKKKGNRMVPNCVPVEEENIEEGQVTGPRSYKGSPDRKRKAVQMALGRKHKDHPDWNERTNPQHSALTLGRKLQKQGIKEEEQIDEVLDTDTAKKSYRSKALSSKLKAKSDKEKALGRYGASYITGTKWDKIIGKRKKGKELIDKKSSPGEGPRHATWTEETLDELSHDTIKDYRDERKRDVKVTNISASHSEDMAKHHKATGNKKKSKEFSDEAKWLRGKQDKMKVGIKLADKKLTGKARVNASVNEGEVSRFVPKPPERKIRIAGRSDEELKSMKDDIKHQDSKLKKYHTAKRKDIKEEKGDRLTPGFSNRKDFDTIAKEIGTGKGGMTIVDKAPKGDSESKQQTIYPMSPKSTSRVAPDDVEKKLDQTTPGNPQAERNRDLHEKLTKKMSAGEVIHDFVHSKSKTFEDDTKKKRIERALGAYYGMHKEEKKEETVLVSPKGYKGGGKVTRIRKKDYDPKKHSLASE